MNFKEKKAFYKERQNFFDAVKQARNGDNPIITYNKKRYKLVYIEDWQETMGDGDYLWRNRCGYAVIYSNKYKSNTLVEYSYGSRNGFVWWGENGRSNKGNYKKILCFAERIN